MYEPLEATKCEKCENIIAELDELIKYRRSKAMVEEEDDQYEEDQEGESGIIEKKEDEDD